MAYHVQCEGFTGPLDLLVSLAYRGQVDFKAVSLRTIAEGYVERARETLDLEEATEVLVHLAVLADLKVRTLVPHAPPAEAPAEETEVPSDLRDRLGAQMAEYLKFREAAHALRVLEEIQSQVFVRSADAPDPHGEVLVEGVTLQDLFAAFAQVLRRAREAPRQIPGEEFTVEGKMEALLGVLRQEPAGVTFEALFLASASRLEIIVTFLAMLELIKQRRIRVRQPKVFGNILVMLVEAS
ncbi:MAG TPA: segregation/condensation protein A [bacterium]|nr:segregation/condensation protein A [bacterium]